MSMENRVSFSEKVLHFGDILYSHHQPDGGRITVLDRETGFGYRDIETGYRCPSGQFWLASGGCDIRDHLREFNSDDEMAEWVKSQAGICRGGHPPWGKVGVSLEQLIAYENRGVV